MGAPGCGGVAGGVRVKKGPVGQDRPGGEVWRLVAAVPVAEHRRGDGKLRRRVR